MNIKDYKEKKAKGLSEIIVAGGGHAMSIKRFSQDDGTEEAPEITAIDIEVIQARKDELVVEIEDCDLVIADVGALKAKK